MVDNVKYKNHLLTASKLGLYGAVKETIYQLISGFYLEENNQEAYTLVNTGYKILGDIYFAKEIFYNKSKTFEAYKKASEMRSKSGKFKYGYCIANGVGCEKNPSLGNSIIDSSNCKYAHNYLVKYTKYNIKNAKPNKNRITVLENAIKVPISFEYRASKRPAPTKQDKNKDAPHLTADGIRILVEKDIKYGIILFNKYSWDNNVVSSIKPLETIASMGSSFGNYQYGYIRYQKGQLEDCIKYVKYATDRGNYYACHFVGRALYNNRIGQYSLAKVYLTKSALELKDSDDQYDLAFLSENNEAITWLEMAVSNDKRTYCLRVADLFRNGIKNGLNPNRSKAGQYYREAIDSGLITNSDDYIRFGHYFYKGEGVPTNKDRAYCCFRSAADKGSSDTAKFVCIMYENNEVSGYSFPEDYYIKAANSGGELASHFAWNLAIHYYQMASSTSTFYHNKAADYFEKCGTSEALENARKIRRAVREYEERQREIERQRREAENNNNDNNSSGGGLLLVSVLA